jgi:hypothetical protein
LKQKGSFTILIPKVLSEAMRFLATFRGWSRIIVVGFLINP